jgi:eukaryotic-like serine/threonine-protein kinase
VVGTRFGNYRSISLLGEGGMGAVYLAEHPDIGRRVAVKVLHTDLTRDPQLLTRFLNEARAANAIHHPNIIEILDSGTTDGGMPYLVMELLEGETLAARVRRLGKLSLAEALDIAYQTASAVGAAHRKNIVHRDLKPDNLFIIADHSNPGRERVKVLDFGIAKLQAKTTPGMMVQTRTGTVMGTPAYMSPEQCLGNRELDARSDIYSLGIILYEMLCGRTPYVSTGFGELLDMHLHAPFPPPAAFGTEVPAGVETIIRGALAKRPEERTQTMADLQAALKAAAEGTKVGISTPDFGGHTMPLGSAAPPALTPQARPAATTFTTGVGERVDGDARPSGRRRLLVAAMVLGGGAGAVLLFGRLRSRTPPAPAPSASAHQPAPPAAAEPAPVPAPPATPPVPVETPPAPTPPATTVELVLESRPSQARVIRLSDGKLLGLTPLRQRLPAGAQPVAVRLEKPGFEPTQRQLSLDRDHKETVTLQRRPPAGRPRPKPPTPAQPDEPAKL